MLVNKGKEALSKMFQGLDILPASARRSKPLSTRLRPCQWAPSFLPGTLTSFSKQDSLSHLLGLPPTSFSNPSTTQMTWHVAQSSHTFQFIVKMKPSPHNINIKFEQRWLKIHGSIIEKGKKKQNWDTATYFTIKRLVKAATECPVRYWGGK